MTSVFGPSTIRTVDNPVDLASRPRYWSVAPNLIVVQFQLMKLLPARALVAAAPVGASLIETTSGTMGLALATVAAYQGLPLTLVTPVLDRYTRKRLLALGRTTLIEVDGDQLVRLDRLKREIKGNPNLHFTNQYGDPNVAKSYAPVAEDLASLQVDLIVAPVGSGGSARGLIEPLRRNRQNVGIVAVDAINSILFGRADGLRRTPGIGSSLRSAHLDHCRFDRIHWLSDATMWAFARAAARDLGLFTGPTGAAALAVARWHAACEPDRRIAAILPDEGHRYLQTVFRRCQAKAIESPIELSIQNAQAFPSPSPDEQCWITTSLNEFHLPRNAKANQGAGR